MRPGRAFEELGAQIYRELSPFARVTHDDHIQGRSGLSRQIDVSVGVSTAAIELLVIVDFKDYKTPANVGDVEEFASKVEDVQASQGILVCRSGFTAGAKRRALQVGIELCNIHDAASRDWKLDVRIPVFWVDLRPHARFDLVAMTEPGDSLLDARGPWRLRGASGEERGIGEEFLSLWNAGHLPREPGTHSIPVGVTDVSLQVIAASGALGWRRLAHLDFVYNVDVKTYRGFLTPEQCRGVLNYRDGSFVASYISLSESELTRDPSWPEVQDPDRLAVATLGTVITTEQWAVEPGSLPETARIARTAPLSAWQREKLAKRMSRWAFRRRCTVCGSYEVTGARMAFCQEHQLGQRFPVCDVHRVVANWPPGIVAVVDWMVDHGFGIPIASVPQDHMPDLEEVDLRSWPHSPVPRSDDRLQ